MFFFIERIQIDKRVWASYIKSEDIADGLSGHNIVTAMIIVIQEVIIKPKPEIKGGESGAPKPL